MTKIVIISHNYIGKEILKTATEILGEIPCDVIVIDVFHDQSYDQQRLKAQKSIHSLSTSEVIILTDIKGASPYNLAKEICPTNGSIICDLNLGMLINLFNYCNLTKAELLQKTNLKVEQ